jgi:hypothetical protein
MWCGPWSRKEISRVKEPHDESRDRVLFPGIYRNPVVAVTPRPRSSVRSGVRQPILLLSTIFAALVVDQLGVGNVELQVKQSLFSSLLRFRLELNGATYGIIVIPVRGREWNPP